MAKQIESFTMFIKATNTQDANPDNWVLERVGCDHVVGESMVPGAKHPKTAKPVPPLILDADTKGLKDTLGTVLKLAQDTRETIKAVEEIA